MSKENIQQIEQVEALLMLYLSEGEVAQALSLLEKYKNAFEGAGAIDSYLFWRVQALVANSQFEEAEEIAKTASDVNRRILVATALEAMAKHSGRWHPLVEHLRDWYNGTGDAKVLLELCHNLDTREAWEELVAYSEELMTKIGTTDALRLAVKAYYKTNKVEECLNLLVKYSSIYEEGILPNDLRRLKVACQTQLGQLSKAVADAEELVRRDPDAQNINLLMEAQLAEGDLKGLVIAARLLISQPTASGKDLLRAARLILHEDIDTARKAWSKADSQRITDEDLGLALDLGFRLGLDSEIGHLTQRAQQLAAEGKGPFKRADFQEIKTWMRSRAENVAFVAEKYDKGEVPIHFFVERLNLTLCRILHSISERNRRKPDPLMQALILCWHGGRSVQRELLKNYADWNLYLDITSLTLAEDLKILNLLQECFPAVRISRFVPTALVQQLDALETHQPALLVKYKTLDRLLREGKAQEAPVGSAVPPELAQLVDVMGEHWTLTISAALQKNCFFVEFTPIVSHDGQFRPVDLPVGVIQKFVNCRSAIDSLRASGHISESVYRLAIEQLGSEGTKTASDTLPTIGADLYLLGNTASLLATDEIIELICQHFRVFIDSQFVHQIKDAIEEEADRAELRQWTTMFLNKVNTAVEQGHFVPIKVEKEQVLETTQDYTVRSFYDFFSFTPQTRDVICIDDRFCNGYSNRDGAPIISLLEIIEVLRIAGKLSEQGYYAVLLRLRASNQRYFAITKEEVLYHLSQAQIIDGSVIETTELRTLRKYVAACLLDNRRLQKPPMQQGASNKDGELGFIVNTIREVADSIIACWENDSSEVAEAKANWILKNLFTGVFGTRHLRVEVEPQSDGLDLLGWDIGGAYARGVTLKESSRKEYFNWLTTRLLRPRLHTDPSSITAIAEGISRLIASITDREGLSEEYNMIQKAMLSELYLDLPKPLQDELRANPELITRLGIQTTDAIVLDDAAFPATKFWDAANNALTNRPTEIVGLSPRDSFVVKASEQEHQVTVIHKKTGHQKNFADPVLRLLYGNPTEWEQLLLSNRPWFDCDNEAMKKKVMEIIALTDPQSRVAEVSKNRESSLALYYERLEGSIRKTNEFAFDKLLPPSAGSLIKHFRISPDDKGSNFRATLEQSALQLINEEGIEDAILRLSCLPVSLPSSIQASLASMEIEQRRAVIKALARRLTSIVQRFHLISLALTVDATATWSLDLAKQAMDALFNDEHAQNDFQLFQSILSWVNDEFAYWADAKTLSPPIRLAMVWAHAIRLHGMFQRAQAEPVETANIFEFSSLTVTAEIFDRDLAYWNDVLHPRRINRTTLLTHGLANALHALSMDTLKHIDIPSRIVALASTETDGSPNPLLLRDSTLGSDALQSIIGGDRWTFLNRHFTDQGKSCIESGQLKALVEKSLDSLLENYTNNSDSWVSLSAIIGDLPMYEDLRPKTKAIIEKVRLKELGEAKDIAISLAIHFLSNQAIYVGSDILRAAFIDQLVGLGQFVPANGDKTDDRESKAFHGALFEALLNASLVPGDPRQSSRSFYVSLSKLWQANPAEVNVVGPSIGRIVFGLPASYLHGAWPLVLSARARAN